ncbi:MAG TPA: glycosyltransferase family 1 protein [Pyrinomonadaceae bacterium]|jgi:glycosyltransferase involved in cell wall biosynthesis|nr:glycosyltransferase family 1 protein [Pyrinomonadaceae bacterium]
MRIGIDGMALAQPKTGVGTYTFELARALALAAPEDEFDLISPLPFGSPVLAETTPANLQLIYLKPNVLQRRWWTIGLPSYLRSHPLDLFHGTNYEAPLRGSCPAVITIHDLSLLLHSSTHEARAVRRARLLLPLMVRQAKAIITPSEPIKTDVSEHLKIDPDKVFATPLAPRSIFKPMSPAETVETRRRLGINDDFLLFVGTIERRKNLSTLITAFEEVLRTTNLRPQLVLAGQVGWKSDELLSQLERSPAHEHIKRIGFVSDEELRALYSSCRAFVYPSIYEGFGLPPLEAMACGAPVVASRVPSINESVARVTSATDFRDLARIVVELLSDQQLRRSLSERGLKHAREFSWAQTAALTREAYARALA